MRYIPIVFIPIRTINFDCLDKYFSLIRKANGGGKPLLNAISIKQIATYEENIKISRVSSSLYQF